jgi:lactoylglutathione lyase
LRCGDIEKAKAFYEVFGMSFLKHAHGKGPQHYSHDDGQIVIELYPAKLTADANGVGFAVKDLKKVRLKFEELGFNPAEITTTEWGNSFVVRDPDNRRVEVKEG